MIHKNLTPFFWAPRITSRKPPQPEMAVCVRAVFQMRPGEPLVAIEDPIQQGFMSGDTFLPDDLNQEGALQHASDFAEWKLHAEMLLKGTCHAPNGPATACDVRFSVGSWSKALQVVGPRAFKPGLLLGGKTSEPQPFTSMPLSWENAFGGENFARNPVGRGHDGEQMPTVEQPGKRLKRTGGNHEPATFLGISPNWPQRVQKRGKNYGRTWQKTRAPFYADDFDWTYFQSAAPDQWLDGYLRGDEQVVLENLHPTAPVWRTQLPGLRIRAFVKGGDGVVREPEMNLDTLLVDTDDGKLSLTWRGHVPVRETDLTCVQVVLIAQEPLAADKLPFSHYEQLLAEFEQDPVGLQAAFPPGFLAVATAIEAAELAERDGTTPPDLEKVAAEMPPDCPFPPWFLAAVGGSADPLGIKAQMPANMLDEQDPLGIKAKVGDLADPAKVDAVMAELPKLKDLPAKSGEVLKALLGLLPGNLQGNFSSGVQTFVDTLGAVQQGSGGDMLAQAVESQAAAKVGGTTSAPKIAESQAQNVDQANTMLDQASATAGGPGSASAPALGAAQGDLAATPSFDDTVAKALAPLDEVQVPEPPPIPEVEADLAAKKAELTQQEAKARGKYGDQAILGLFAMGHRMIDNAPRPGDLVPNLAPVVAGLGAFAAQLSAQGASEKALGPLLRLQAKVKKLVDALPQPTPKPAGEYVRADLRGRDFSGRDLRGAVFEQADLTGAKFVGSDLTGANFRSAELSRADLSGAKLSDANFSRTSMQKAILRNTTGERTVFTDADLSEADLSQAQLPDAKFEQARLGKARLPGALLRGADLRFAELSKCDLQDADLTGADLSMASGKMAKLDRACLAEAKFDMGSFDKCRLQGANLQGARSSMGSLGGCDLSGADLRGCHFEKVDFMKAVLDGANCDGADLRQAILRDTRAIGATFRGAKLHGVAVTGVADFSRAVFTEADGMRSTWMDVQLSGANFARSSFLHAYFQGSKGDDVDFLCARLKGACFRKVQLRRPRFLGADLASADFTSAALDDANFRGSNCYDTKFLGARAVRSDFDRAFVIGMQLDDPDAVKAGQGGQS